jgi:DNA replication protein DnaC
MYFNFENCYAKDFNPVCRNYPEGCNRYCWGFHSLQVAYNLSNIPEIYRRLPEIEIPEEDKKFISLFQKLDSRIKGFVKEGHGLFIFGNAGSGKTMWACKLGQSYIKKYAKKVAHRRLVYFIDINKIIDLSKAEYNTDERLQFIEMRQGITEADLVIWDNIEGPYTDYERNLLFNYINERYSNEKAQIFTSYFDLDILEGDSFLGKKIVDRIRGQCYEARLISSSKRKKRRKLPAKDDE